MRTVERVVPRDGDDLGELLAEAEYKWMLKYRRSKKVRLLNTQMIPYSRGRSGRSLQAAIDRFRVYCQMRGRLYTTELARLIDGFLTDRTSN